MACLNANSGGHPQALRIALFGPQVTHWTRESLSDLRSTLLQDSRFGFLKQTLAELPSLWSTLEESFGPGGFPGLKQLEAIRDFASGSGTLDPEGLSNIQLAPLTVVSQAIDLIRHSSTTGAEKRLPEFEATQGFCLGFLSAAALASAQDWPSLERGTSNAIRLAACVGVVIDVEDASHPAEGRSTAISVRWKTAADRAFLDTCLESVPEVSLLHHFDLPRADMIY